MGPCHLFANVYLILLNKLILVLILTYVHVRKADLCSTVTALDFATNLCVEKDRNNLSTYTKNTKRQHKNINQSRVLNVRSKSSRFCAPSRTSALKTISLFHDSGKSVGQVHSCKCTYCKVFQKWRVDFFNLFFWLGWNVHLPIAVQLSSLKLQYILQNNKDRASNNLMYAR